MDNKIYKLMNWPRIEGIIYSEEDNPHEILGPHIAGKSTLFQTFQPGAVSVDLILKDDKKKSMEQVDDAGFFACLIPGKIPDVYEYEVHFEEGITERIKDAYRYSPVMEQKDIDKWNAGIFYDSYEKLGAHPMTLEGVEGTCFAVWAPNAIRVSVVGDFNHWDGRKHPMKKNQESGIFQLFIPDVKPGDCYKYEIKSKGDIVCLKADPYAFGQQMRPDTASVVRELSYQWKDSSFMKDRKKKQVKDAPVSVYELYLGSFLRDKDTGGYLNYRDLAPAVADYVKEMGYTHVELMPVMEHPLDASWGYQVIGYYAPTSRYGSAEDFMYFVDTLHQAGIGVILDWVPAHFPRDSYGLAKFDGTCLYEHLDPRQGAHPHWGTLIYNYGRPQVSNYLISNALYWVEKYHADGIRMDAVASMLYLDYGKKDGEWVANIYGGNENLEAVEFLKHLNSIMKKRNPGVYMIAEESTAWPRVTGQLEDDGLGFDMKWNMGLMNDYLTYIGYDPYFRAHHHNELIFSMIYAYSENFMTVFSHDEVVHGKSTMIGKMPGVKEDKFANLRLTYGYMMTHPGKKLLFMGQDIAEFKEFDETRQTEWGLLQQEEHKGVNRLMKDLNRLYKEKPALYAKDTSADGFEWMNCISPERCMLAFLRKTDKAEDTLLVVANFAGIEQNFTVGVPYEGKYKELLNTDNGIYGGKNCQKAKMMVSEEAEADGRPYSVNVTLAPLSLVIYSYTPFTKKEKLEMEKRKVEKEARERAKEAELAAQKAQEEVMLAQKALNEAVKKAQEAQKLAELESEKAKKAEEELKALKK
ncbi:MAG: 1,4-alpha-glucan branching protein GlgB [Lachnospiraceae bacterium]|nr:1,4-alpha-glucan branching protein GlgB [Lachnospiraceae bacterium]